jgi:hypothetical protein
MDLVSADETALVGVGRLLEAAVQVPWVLVPVACKVLHRKRPRLIPMLDNVVLGHYQHALSEPWLAAASQDKRRAAAAGMRVLVAFRDDLRAVAEPLGLVIDALAQEGCPLTPVRALEVLVWTQVEPYGQYRAQPAAVPAAAHVPGGSGPDSAGGLRVWAASFARARGIAEAELRVEPPLHPEELGRVGACRRGRPGHHRGRRELPDGRRGRGQGPLQPVLARCPGGPQPRVPDPDRRVRRAGPAPPLAGSPGWRSSTTPSTWRPLPRMGRWLYGRGQA